MNGHIIPNEHQIKVVCYCEVEYLGMFFLDLKIKMHFGKMKMRLNDKDYLLQPLVTHLVLLVLQNLQVVFFFFFFFIGTNSVYINSSSIGVDFYRNT